MSVLSIRAPAVFEPLNGPARYKGAWGGRGSGKSHYFASLMVRDALNEPGLLAVCIREIQKSLKHSAKRLIEARLATYGLGEADGFKVFKEVIQTPGDGIIRPRASSRSKGLRAPGSRKRNACRREASSC